MEENNLIIVDQKHLRFSDAPWFLSGDSKQTILIGGAGGTGSWVSFLLARANFDIVLYDMDRIESYNMAGQLYSEGQVGLYKVNAISSTITQYCKESISTYSEEYTESSPEHYLSIAAFDNMKARKIMFNNWKKTVKAWNEKDTSVPIEPLFVDMRLSAEHMQIICVTTDEKRIEEYERVYLFDDDEVEEAPCTFKQTSHAAAMIASHTVGFITNHISNQFQKDVVRRVPFYWEYFIPIDFSKIEYEV